MLTLSFLGALSVALAHLVNSSPVTFYVGALHLLLCPADLLGLVAAALLAGLVRTESAYRGGNVVAERFLAHDPPRVGRCRHEAVADVIRRSLYAVFHGLLDSSALSVIGTEILSLFGIEVPALILALLVSATVVPLQTVWSRIAIRVAAAGSRWSGC